MTVKDFCEKYYVERRGTGSRKWDDEALLDKYGAEGLLSFWIADMDFKCPDSVLEALSARVEHGAFGYTYPAEDYFNAVINWQRDHFGAEIKKEQIRFSPGVMAAVTWLLNAYASANESVLIFTPVYYPFRGAINDTGKKLVCCELVNTGGYYTIDFELFEKQVIEENVKVIIFCSPHNPVGRVWKEDELRRFLEICEKHDVLIFSDEIHEDIVYGDNKQISLMTVDGGKYADRIITNLAATKTFNIASLPNSHTIITNEALMRQYDEYKKTVDRTETNVLSLIATQTAYGGDNSEWLSGLLDTLWGNFELARDMLKEGAPKVIVTPLEGTYLMWMDLRGYLKEDEIENFCINKCKLALDYGEWFSTEAKGFIRINIATHPKNIKEAISRIISGINELK